MIAFRAPDDVSQMLDDAQYVTGCDRTELILTTIKEFLPNIVRRLGVEHQRRLAQAQEAFDERTKTPTPTQKNAEEPRGEASSPPRSRNRAATGSGRKPRQFPKG